MSKKEKLIAKLKSKSRNFTFDEAEALLLSLGFEKSNKGKTSGSRVLFKYGDIHLDMHKPHPHNVLLRYQLNDLLDTLTEGGLI